MHTKRLVGEVLALSLAALLVAGCGHGGDRGTEQAASGLTSANEAWRPKPEDIARVGLRKGYKTMPDYLESGALLDTLSPSELNRLDKATLEKRAARMNELLGQYSGPTNRMPKEVEEAPDVVIWPMVLSGLPEDVLRKLHEPYRELRDDEGLTPEESEELNWRGIGSAGDAPLLIISTGALSGLTAESPQREQLRAYVEAGGVVLIMAQIQGVDYSAVPVPPGEMLEGVGYGQDVSNLAAPVDPPLVRVADHPILNDFPSPEIPLKVDGFFLRYPRQATVLLRRKDTGMACLLVYPLGKGWVVATSAFQACEADKPKPNPELVPLFAGLVAWAKDSAHPIPTRVMAGKEPEGTLPIQMDVLNVTGKSADGIEYAVWTPDRSEQLHLGFTSLAVPAGGKAMASFDVKLGELHGKASPPMGTYHIDYRLVNRRFFFMREQVQPWAESGTGRFALTRPPALTDGAWHTYYTAWADTDDPDKSKHLVSVYVEDRTGKPRDLHLWTNYSKEAPVLLDSIHLEPNEGRVLSYPYGLTRLGSYHFWLLDPVVGTAVKPSTMEEWGGEPWKLVGKRWVVMHK